MCAVVIECIRFGTSIQMTIDTIHFVTKILAHFSFRPNIICGINDKVAPVSYQFTKLIMWYFAGIRNSPKLLLRNRVFFCLDISIIGSFFVLAITTREKRQKGNDRT